MDLNMDRFVKLEGPNMKGGETLTIANGYEICDMRYIKT